MALGSLPKYLRRALRLLRTHGLLLESDAELPSLSTLVAGTPVRGSWWGHPRGKAIFLLSRQLQAHPDVAVTKLVSGKVTFVHRTLWPALRAVAEAREPWQQRGLSRAARSLEAGVNRKGELRTDRIEALPGVKPDEIPKAARELEARLLVASRELHTESGAHSKHLESWERWARRVGCPRPRITAGEGKRRLEEALERLSRGFPARGRLPWVLREKRRARALPPRG